MKSGRLLVVEDSEDMRGLLVRNLEDIFEVRGVASISAARKSLEETEFDLLLLDVSLPDGNGIKWLAEFRVSAKGRDMPVIFVSGGMDVDERVLGFSLGAEDVVLKPFHPAELKARILARLRKRINKPADTVVCGNVRVDTTRQAVRVGDGGMPIELTSHECRILSLLAGRADTVFTRDQIIDGAWGRDVHVFERTVDSHISRLRKKLRGASHTIHSVRGSGYRFGPADEEC